MRLEKIMPEYQGRVRLRVRPFPLEVGRGPAVAAPRDVLEQEWWLAALQEPDAVFAPFQGDDWPTTTLPAFDAAWCAAQQGEAAGHDFDLRVRRAFFAEGRNIGRRDVLLDLARDMGLDVAAFWRTLDSGEARAAVLADYQLGRERYAVRGTPTLMLSDGTELNLPIAFPKLRHRRIVSVEPLPCHGAGCLEATRTLIDRAFRAAPVAGAVPGAQAA